MDNIVNVLDNINKNILLIDKRLAKIENKLNNINNNNNIIDTFETSTIEKNNFEIISENNVSNVETNIESKIESNIQNNLDNIQKRKRNKKDDIFLLKNINNQSQIFKVLNINIKENISRTTIKNKLLQYLNNKLFFNENHVNELNIKYIFDNLNINCNENINFIIFERIINEIIKKISK
jgi:hypothetical protein